MYCWISGRMKVNVGVIGAEEPPLGCESSSCSSYFPSNMFSDMFFNPRRQSRPKLVLISTEALKNIFIRHLLLCFLPRPRRSLFPCLPVKRCCVKPEQLAAQLQTVSVLLTSRLVYSFIQTPNRLTQRHCCHSFRFFIVNQQ